MHYRKKQSRKKSWKSLKHSRSRVQSSDNYIFKCQLFRKPALELTYFLAMTNSLQSSDNSIEEFNFVELFSLSTYNSHNHFLSKKERSNIFSKKQKCVQCILCTILSTSLQTQAGIQKKFSTAISIAFIPSHPMLLSWCFYECCTEILTT